MNDHILAGEKTGKPCPPSMPFFFSYTLQAYPIETCRILQVPLLASEWPMLGRLPYLLIKVTAFPSEEAICIYKKLDQTPGCLVFHLGQGHLNLIPEEESQVERGWTHSPKAI